MLTRSYSAKISLGDGQVMVPTARTALLPHDDSKHPRPARLTLAAALVVARDVTPAVKR